MASGLAAFDHAVFMTRLMFPYIACMSLVALAAGVLNTWRRFAVPAATPVLLNLSWIVAAWWGAPWFARMGLEPIYAVAAGVMVGGLLQLAVQWPALRKVGMAPVQRQGMEYEFTIVGDMDLDHNFVVSKSRIADLADAGAFGARGAPGFARSADWRVEADRLLADIQRNPT